MPSTTVLFSAVALVVAVLAPTGKFISNCWFFSGESVSVGAVFFRKEEAYEWLYGIYAFVEAFSFFETSVLNRTRFEFFAIA